MPGPESLEKHVRRLNTYIAHEIGNDPGFGWVWGNDLIARVPSHDRLGNPLAKPAEHQTTSGLFVITHQPIERDVFLVEPPLRRSYIFCFNDRSPLAFSPWQPWCPPHAYTPDMRYRVHILHSAPDAAPTLDYTQKILVPVREGLAARRVAREQLDLELRSRMDDQEAKRERQGVLVASDKIKDQMPVGFFRQAGTKAHVSFPTPKGHK